MKTSNYIGIDEDVITIQQPTDIYPLLDWLQTQMVNQSEKAKGTINIAKWEKAANFIETLMEQAQAAGFGSADNIDEIEY